MKHIKKFETNSVDHLEYNVGDYIFINSDELEIAHKPAIIRFLHRKGCVCKFINPSDEEVDVDILFNEIERKLNEPEILAIKYNL